MLSDNIEVLQQCKSFQLPNRQDSQPPEVQPDIENEGRKRKRSFNIHIDKQEPHKLDIITNDPDQNSDKENTSPVDTDLRRPPVVENDRPAFNPTQNSGYMLGVAEANEEKDFMFKKRAIEGIHGYFYRTQWTEGNDSTFLEDLSRVWDCHLANHQESLDGDWKLVSEAFSLWLEEQKIRVQIRDHPDDEHLRATFHELKIRIATRHRPILSDYVRLVALAFERIVGVHDLSESFECVLRYGPIKRC